MNVLNITMHASQHLQRTNSLLASLHILFCTNFHFLYYVPPHPHPHPRYLDAIERAVANGDCLLLENIGESVDPVLDPLLGRLTIKKGKYIKIGDKEVEYSPRFRFILQVCVTEPCVMI